MRRVAAVLGALCLVAFVLMLCGCGSSGGSDDLAMVTTAKKPAPDDAEFTVVDLAPTSVRSSWANDINEDGCVVGHWDDTSGVRRAFRWTSTEGVVTLTGADSPSYAMGINNAGDIVGAATFAAGTHATMWPGGGSATDLGTLGNPDMPRSTAVAVNSSGEAVGYCFNQDATTNRAFLWNGSSMGPLGTLADVDARANDINEDGWACGYTASTGTRRAFLWDGTTVQDLSALVEPPATTGYCEAQALNATQVVGTSVDGTGSAACVWEDGSVVALPSVKRSIGGVAHCITATGQVAVGAWSDRNDVQHACIWRNGAAEDLNKLIPSDSGWDLTMARAVNSDGWIVGYGLKDGQTRGFVLIPK